jgi:radical SAM superfamily enzyme YgiQ (UPF0313 family)
MKVLLLSANTVRVPYYVYPIGLDYVRAAIAGRHETHVIDMNKIKKPGALKEAVMEFGPEVAGISLRNIDNTEWLRSRAYSNDYAEIVKTIRSFSSALIVIGGSGFTIFPDELMEALDADYGIIGEGERFPMLLDAIEKGINPVGLPGVIKRGGAAFWPKPWEGDFARCADGFGGAGFYIEHGGMLNLQTKRGCPYRCVYCTYPHIEGGSFRFADPEKVYRTAIDLESLGAKYIFITDSVFNGDYSQSLEIAGGLKAAGLKIPWGAFFSPTRPPDSYYRELADSGCTHVEFGTESLCDDVLKSYKKPFSSADVLASHWAAVDAGLFVSHYLLLGGPGETRDSVIESLDRAAGLDRCALFIFTGMRIYPHTDLYDIALADGQISQGSLLKPVYYESQYITSEEIMRLVEARARGRENWFFGQGLKVTARLVSRMHREGHSGPLWEHMIR